VAGGGPGGPAPGRGGGAATGFAAELTEALLLEVPELTGAQIVRIRQTVADVARARGVSL
jgi:hypothetical protein